MPSSAGSLVAELGRLGVPRGTLGRQMSLGTFVQAVLSLLRVLDSLAPFSQMSREIKLKTMSMELSSWTLHVYERLWTAISEWVPENLTKSEEATSRVISHFLESMQSFCNLRQPHLNLGRSDTEKLRVWLTCLADALFLRDLHQLPSLRPALDQSFEVLMESLPKATELGGVVEEEFLPRVVTLQMKRSDPSVGGAWLEVNGLS